MHQPQVPKTILGQRTRINPADPWPALKMRRQLPVDAYKKAREKRRADDVHPFHDQISGLIFVLLVVDDVP
ncbi:hypothetical protein D5400_10460 [Georhizobium profundi]|uniref:Uncharacterized protein n=1 Tax=Georhizobium profundi TaxID=2341112 RepID=A0A3S9B3Y8_9HYPH|nr:hypothetical protein D5400_10460 [Georhizobium profundi]